MDAHDKRRRTQIAALNDQVRRSPHRGEMVATPGVLALGAPAVARLLGELSGFAAFTPANDPYGEHDFGIIEIGDSRVFWKIDYYNLDLTGGCETPWDGTKCRRVLTLMLAVEY